MMSARRRSVGVRTESQSVSEPVRDRENTAHRTHRRSLGSQKLLKSQLHTAQREAKEIIQPLLDTENGFVKDLECYLNNIEYGELQKRALLHKRWTECVWHPVQRSVEEHVTNHSNDQSIRLRSMLTRYINYCNSKGFVFLEDYDPLEYNPFLLQTSRPDYYKISTPGLKDPLFLQSRARVKEKRAVLRCQTGSVYSRQKVEELLQWNKNSPSQSKPRRTDTTASPPNTVTAPPTNTVTAPPTAYPSDSLKERESLWRSSRGRATLYLSVTEGRCLKPGCWSATKAR